MTFRYVLARIKQAHVQSPNGCVELQRLQLNKPLQKRSPPFESVEGDHPLEPLLAWNLHLKPFAWNLGTSCILYLEPLLGTSEPARSFTWSLLEPFNWNLYLEPLHRLELLLGTSANLYIGTLAWTFGTFRNLLGTSEPFGTFTWNFGTFRNPHLEPLFGASEPLGTFPKNPFLELWNLPKTYLYLNLFWNSYLEPWNFGTSWVLYLEPFLGTWEPPGTFTWNPYLEPRNLPEPLLGTLTWNLGTSRNLAG